jgi:tRNA(fMet)-specific endonuclease VapC
LAFLLDTNVAIHMRDRNPSVLYTLRDRAIRPRFSIVTQVELAGGLARDVPEMPIRRARFGEMIGEFEWLAFEQREAEEYRRIVSILGFSRTKILDRMIAAQAIVADATLITLNGADFLPIPNLKLEVWPTITAS